MNGADDERTNEGEHVISAIADGLNGDTANYRLRARTPPPHNICKMCLRFTTDISYRTDSIHKSKKKKKS